MRLVLVRSCDSSKVQTTSGRECPHDESRPVVGLTWCSAGVGRWAPSHHRRASRVLLFLSFSLAIAGGAAAQSADPDPSATGLVNLGSFSFTPAVVLSAGPDSNPYREPGRVGTFEVYATPQIAGWFSGQTSRASFWGAAEVVRFSNMVGATNWQVGGRLERTAATVRPYINYNLKNTNANPTGFEVGHKSMRIEGDLVAGTDFRTAPLAFGGSFRSVNTNWAADAIYQGSSLREKLNRRTNVVRGSVGFALTPLTNLEFAAEGITDRFVYSPVRDANSVTLLPGVTIASPATIQGSLWIGYRFFHPLSPTGTDFAGVVGNGTLVYARPAGGSLAFRYQRDLQFSYDPSLAYYLQNSFNLTGVLPLSARWKVQGVVATTALNYEVGGSGLPGPLQRVNEIGAAIGFGIGSVTVVGVSTEWANAMGPQGWKELRVVVFLTYGSEHGAYQRLDRPIPFSR
jgi:hypothetical protein